MAFLPSLLPNPVPSERCWFVVHPKGVVGLTSGRLGLTDAECLDLGVTLDEGHSIGVLNGQHAMAIPWVKAPESVPAGFGLHGLRALATSVDAETFSVAARALHLGDWATTSRYCGRCGTPTERMAEERCMRCPRCQLTQYPRISPAIITLVRRGDEALLARNARFPGAFFSTLAGFSEVGETLEETLVREVREEVGVTVHELRYFGSQPWPFPHSLMVAFTAQWRSGEIQVDGKEIAEAGWFKATELPVIPPSLSIARRMIDAWVAETRSP